MTAKLFKLLLLSLVCVLSSCNRSWCEVRDMEQLLGTRLRGSVSFIDRQEEWYGLNGYGEKVVMFDVLDAKPFEQCHMLPYDSMWVEQSFSQNRFYSHLKGTAGYYVEQHEDDMLQYLFYDTVDNRLVYYLSIM